MPCKWRDVAVVLKGLFDRPPPQEVRISDGSDARMARMAEGFGSEALDSHALVASSRVGALSRAPRTLPGSKREPAS